MDITMDPNINRAPGETEPVYLNGHYIGEIEHAGQVVWPYTCRLADGTYVESTNTRQVAGAILLEAHLKRENRRVAA